MGRQPKPRILFIDAHDSFSENICALLTQALDADITFVTIDADEHHGATFEALLDHHDALILGPGPGNPDKASDIGIIPAVWSIARANAIPVLGICLGFQSLCLTFGASIVRMPLPCHGLAKTIHHSDTDMFSGAGTIIATNYNSLAVKLSDILQAKCSRSASLASTNSDMTDGDSDVSLPENASHSLIPLAWDDSGWLMGVRHKRLPFWGVQFHPESCKSSQSCSHILQAWWEHASEWNRTYRPAIQRRRDSNGAGDGMDKPMARDDVSYIMSNTSCSSASALSAHRGFPQNDHRELRDFLHQLASVSGSMVYSTTSTMMSEEAVATLCREVSPTWTAMLESTKKGRYSIYAIPSPSSWRLEVFEHEALVSTDSGSQNTFSISNSDIFHILREVLNARIFTGGDPDMPFWGGFLGFFSYELGLRTARFGPERSSHDRIVPEASLVWTERSVVIDHLERKVFVQSIRRHDMKWVQQFAAQLGRLECKSSSSDLGLQTALAKAQSILPDEKAYKAKIGTCQQELRAGNSYELCLTAEAKVKLPAGHSWSLYQNLRRCNPVPFAAYLQLGKITILSSSPEQFLCWNREGNIDMVPMKGTVKKTPEMTFAKAAEILASPKESAENLMIADLIRHDLYRALGSHASVDVAKLCEVVEHETVYQLVSHIRANPPPELSSLSDAAKQAEVTGRGLTALAHALPPGSMTGAPKKRSCEILSALEQRPRGVYSGVLGYLDVGGGGGFSVCIRSAMSSLDDTEDGQQTWRIGAGGAITVLSDADAEWEEMRTKMESVLRGFRVEE